MYIAHLQHVKSEHSTECEFEHQLIPFTGRVIELNAVHRVPT